MRINFRSGEMGRKYGAADCYQTEHARSPAPLPTTKFFLNTLRGPMLWLWQKAKNGSLDDYAWVYGSQWLADIFENIGGRIEIDGLRHLNNGPYVIIANHMSTLETFLLPGIVRPAMPVTFVVKKSLTKMPVFGPIMRSRDPVTVERANPREDLAVVLNEGVARLNSGISLIIFPQHTRSLHFDPAKFNSIGTRLAAKADVPVIPLALKTDAWGQGKRIKELGRVRPDLPARFRFGAPLAITGKGRAEHNLITGFIRQNIADWQASDGINS